MLSLFRISNESIVCPWLDLQVEVVALSSYEEKEEKFKEEVITMIRIDLLSLRICVGYVYH